MPRPSVLPATWRPIPAASDHPLAPLVRREVGQGVRLLPELGPPDRHGIERFRILLESRELGRTTRPAVAGLLALDRDQPGWIEVTAYRTRLPLEDGRFVEVPDGILLKLVEGLAEVVPPGGSIVVGYDAPDLASTARALAAGVPPIATPLGGMLFAAGCASRFRDWPAAAGGRGGRRRLQAFRAADRAQDAARGFATLAELEAFLARSKELDWDVQAQTRPIADATIRALHALLDVPEPAPPPR